MTPRDKDVPSALKRVQEHRRIYGLAVLSNVCALQKLLKHAFAAPASADKDESSLEYFKKEYE